MAAVLATTPVFRRFKSRPMTDVPPDANDTPVVEGPPPSGPGIRILAQFTRDFSFENPRAPDSLRSDGPQPQIDLGVEMRARGRPDGLFEIDLKLSTTAASNGQTAFQIELLYGGRLARVDTGNSRAYGGPLSWLEIVGGKMIPHSVGRPPP